MVDTQISLQCLQHIPPQRTAPGEGSSSILPNVLRLKHVVVGAVVVVVVLVLVLVVVVVVGGGGGGGGGCWLLVALSCWMFFWFLLP